MERPHGKSRGWWVKIEEIAFGNYAQERHDGLIQLSLS
jgi:hypothetical protein